MKYNPYSFTKIDTFRQCPKKFQYIYVDKVKVPWKPQIHFERGKFLHLLQEYKGDVAQCKNHSDFKKMKLMTPEIIQECIGIHENFNNSVLGKWHSSKKIVGDEVSIALGKKLEPTDFANYMDVAKFGTDNIFQGYIDRLSVVEEKDLLIINDWKSGKFKTDPDFAQLLYYAIWAFGQVPYDNILIMLTYLEHNKSHQKLLKREDLPKYKIALINDISKIEKEEEFPREENSLCNYCDFQDLCTSTK